MIIYKTSIKKIIVNSTENMFKKSKYNTNRYKNLNNYNKMQKCLKTHLTLITQSPISIPQQLLLTLGCTCQQIALAVNFIN
jgi:hypothetical protein